MLGPRSFSMLPDVVKNLLIINGLMFLATIVLQANFDINLNDSLGLHYFASEKFEIYQLVTYMFMHGSFSHLFFNMFAVWMFGTTIENTWGPKRFLTYYVLTGFGAAFLHYLIIHFEIRPDIQLMEQFINNPTFDSLTLFTSQHQFLVSPHYTPHIYMDYENFKMAFATLQINPNDFEALNTSSSFISQYLEYFKNRPNVVGASGSLFGILLAFGMMFPNAMIMMLFIPVPIKAKYFVLGYGVIELISGLTNSPSDNVAHFAHLGGMLFGFFVIKFWQKKGEL